MTLKPWIYVAAFSGDNDMLSFEHTVVLAADVGGAYTVGSQQLTVNTPHGAVFSNDYVIALADVQVVL